MDMGGTEEIALLRLRSEDSSATGNPVRTAAIVGLVAVMALAGWFAWSRSQRVERLCTLAGVIHTPIAASPAEAFEAWWADPGPEQVRLRSSVGHVAPEGTQPSRDDFARLDETSWEWIYSDGYAIGVDVGPAASPATGETAETWAVTQVSQCSYGPFDYRGGA